MIIFVSRVIKNFTFDIKASELKMNSNLSPYEIDFIIPTKKKNEKFNIYLDHVVNNEE